MSELRYVNLTPDLAEQCEALELSAFPHADPADLLSADDIRTHAAIFPEGFFVVLDGDTVVGQGAGIYVDFDFDHPQHDIHEITGESYCGNHDPDADWYYGTDIVVHPDHRRKGIGKRLYELRKGLVIQDNKRGIIAGGHIPGFGAHKHELSPHEYVDKVVAGDLYDPTLTFQLGNGFEVRGLLENYIEDEETDGWSTLIVWENPDFRA